MKTAAIDIGGSKFSIALFEGDRMVRRESRATDREAGRDWMLGQIQPLLREWMEDGAIDRCGIGFGGPVFFEDQRVVLSTHVGGWADFDLPGFIEGILRVRPVMDNDANVGALGEAMYGAACN